MKAIVFSAHDCDRKYLQHANDISGARHELQFVTEELSTETVDQAAGYGAVACFVTDDLSSGIIEKLASHGVKLIVLRSAGYDHVDLQTATKLNITVARVPEYSPQAVAEFAVGLLLNLTRKILVAQKKIQSGNFQLDGLLGCNLSGKVVGIIGTGHIGSAFAEIMHGFGCQILAHDPIKNHRCVELGVKYVALPELFTQSDVISLHCLLNNATRHIINKSSLAMMKKSAVLINTGRGPLIDTAALLSSLKAKAIGGVGLDVYEREKGLFFADHSRENINDDYFNELQTFPNVIMTGHMAFFSEEALSNIARVTIDNLTAYSTNSLMENRVL